MSLPPGMQPKCGNRKEKVLLFLKSLYGLKQAAHNWFNTIKLALTNRGFQQSKVDPCVFINNDMVVLVYVDDCLLFAPKESSSIKI